MLHYVVYKRVSSKEQGRSGLGLDAQALDIRVFLESFSPEPYEVIAEFTEIQSGADSSRPKLAQAVALAQKHRATLLVSKIDRLARDVADGALLLKDKRLKVKVASMPYADSFQLHIHLALAQQEREFISQRTKAALKQAKARGVKLGGPKWRETLQQGRKTNVEQAGKFAENLLPIVREVQAAGVDTLQGIADALNARGIKSRRGSGWYPSTIRNLLARA